MSNLERCGVVAMVIAGICAGVLVVCQILTILYLTGVLTA